MARAHVQGRQAALLALSISLSLTGCQRSQKAPAPKPQASAQGLEHLLIKLPKELEATDGPRLLQRIRASYRQGTLVNVWASWCGSCIRELPMLIALREEYKAKGIDFLFVSVDELTQAPAAVKRLREAKAPLPGLIVEGPLVPFKKAMSPRWPGSLPASFLFDGAAELQYIWPAEVYERELRPVLDSFLEGSLTESAAAIPIRQSPQKAP